MNLDLQQRAVEYHSVIKRHDNLREGLFEQMPPLEMKVNLNTNGQLEDDALNGQDELKTEEDKIQEQERYKKEAAKTLIDLFDDDESTEPVVATQAAHTSALKNTKEFDILNILDQPSGSTNQASNNLDALFSFNAPKKNNLDMLDIFGDGKSTHNGLGSGLDDLLGLGSSSQTQIQNTPVSNGNDLLNMFSAPNSQVNKTNGMNSSSLVVYEKNELKVTLEPAADGNHSSQEQHFIQMKAENLGITNLVREFLFSAAVPKTMQMQLSQPNTTSIEALDCLQQTIAIANPKKVCF